LFTKVQPQQLFEVSIFYSEEACTFYLRSAVNTQ